MADIADYIEPSKDNRGQTTFSKINILNSSQSLTVQQSK